MMFADLNLPSKGRLGAVEAAYNRSAAPDHWIVKATLAEFSSAGDETFLLKIQKEFLPLYRNSSSLLSQIYSRCVPSMDRLKNPACIEAISDFIKFSSNSL